MVETLRIHTCLTRVIILNSYKSEESYDHLKHTIDGLAMISST